MFDKNYLGHNLELFTKYYPSCDYKCTICGIEIFYENSDNDYWIIKNSIDDSIEYCALNCKEFMIKSIIE